MPQRRSDLPLDDGGVSCRFRHETVGALEVTVNVSAFRELQRVLANVPVGEFNIAHWDDCACGHARRDSWFQNQGFTSCYSFVDAAAFFGITRKEAIRLFSGNGHLDSPMDVIKRIDALLDAHEPAEEARQHARRQAVIDALLKQANRAAAMAKTGAAVVLLAMFL